MSDINAKQSQDGVTPLHLASRYNSGDVTQYLLFKQADINARDAKGRTPLHYATRRGHELVTKACLMTLLLLSYFRLYIIFNLLYFQDVVSQDVVLFLDYVPT